MVNNPLVLVLGAGASYPYGFPLGYELRLELCDLKNDTSLLRASLVKNANLDDTQLREFANSFRLSSIKSIDAFLAKRSEFATIGKLAIAGSLLSKNHQKIKEPASEDDWYLEVWNALQSSITSINELKNNKIKIITFNYDYSLEIFLHCAITHTFGVSSEDAFAALKYIPILHVYGCIKNIDSASALTNQTTFNEQSLKYASEGIKIIPESRDDDASFEKARDWFNWASNICFLGFGFDELNIKRLDLNSVIDHKNTNHQQLPRIVASIFGMTANEADLARRRLGITVNWNPVPHKNLMAIRERIEIFT